MASWRDYWQRYRGSRGPLREVLTIALCLAIGVLLMPPAIWLVGGWKLGPYANGGLGALWRDFLTALLHGSLVFWLVALGPYAAVWLLRGARFGLRH